MISLHAYLSPDASGALPMSPETAGLEPMGGGCRAGFSGLVRALAQTGRFDVTALSTYRTRRTELGGVTYLRLDEAGKLPKPDVALAYYDTRPLIGLDAKVRIASHHTCIPHHTWQWNTVNTAPCGWAVDYLRRGYAPHAKWDVLPNAVSGLDGVRWGPQRGRVLHHFSPDRGAHLMLNAWPKIRARIPYAELHMTGMLEGVMLPLRQPSVRGSYEWRRAEETRAGIAAAEAAGGFRRLGRVSRADLLREISEASCVAGAFETSAPCETFSVSILESCAIGAPVIMTPVDALWSVYHNSGAIMCQEPARYSMDQFVEAVCDVLTDDEMAKRMSDKERSFASMFTFERAASCLDRIVTRELEEMSTWEPSWQASDCAV